MSPPCVRLRDVHKAFSGRVILDRMDLDVFPGEVVGLVGPNGGGKSSTLSLIAGLVRADRGTVEVHGAPAHTLALGKSGTVGLITAIPGLYPQLTGWENLEFFGSLYGLETEETRRRVTPLAEELGVATRLEQRAAACSSGQQQKISALRSLLMDPAVLLLDEPTANLDPFSARVLVAAARAHADRGRAVVWVTHDLPTAEQICDRVAIILGRVRQTVSFAGPRGLAPESTLTRAWRDALGEAG